MPNFLTLDDIDVRGKRVLLRADLNVPVKDGRVTDATRIERLAPTIEALIGKGAAVVVMSHFGRPKGRPDPALSLRPLVAPLRQALGGREVSFADGLHRRAGKAGRRRTAGRVRSRSSKICASIRGRRRTRPILPGRSPSSAMSMSTTRSRRRIARMPRSRRSRICCRPPPAS